MPTPIAAWWRIWTDAAQTGLRVWETMAASAVVIDQRMPVIDAGLRNPWTADHVELTAMVTEKAQAFAKAGDLAGARHDGDAGAVAAGDAGHVVDHRRRARAFAHADRGGQRPGDAAGGGDDRCRRPRADPDPCEGDGECEATAHTPKR